MKKKHVFRSLCILTACILLKMPYAHSAQWEIMDSGTTRNLHGITGFDIDNIHTVGAKGTILHYDGSAWAPQASGTTWTLYSVCATGPDNLYAAGDNRGVLRNAGSGWSIISSSWSESPLYAFGGPCAASGEMVGVGKTRTIRGVRYNTVAGAGGYFASRGHLQFSNNLLGLFTTPSGDTIVTGTRGLIAHYRGHDSGMNAMYNVHATPTKRTISDAWGTDVNNLFAVGHGGTILRRSGGGAWLAMQSGTTANLNAVWGTALDNVYAVGAKGTVLHYDGSSWQQIEVPTRQQLNDVWGISANEVFAVGNKGVIIRSIGRQQCYCPDETTGLQFRNAGDTGWDPCSCAYYSVWCDPSTDICWQDPQKDYLTQDYNGIVSYDAERYCDELVVLGYDDWRLPTVVELRSLIRGNTETEYPDGPCPLWDGSPFADAQDSACLGRADGGGPGVEGCYWPDILRGSCHRPDPATHGIHPLEYWAVGAAADRPEWIACVLFDSGAVTYNHINSLGEVRCIRDTATVPVTCDDPSTCTPGETRQCTASNGKTGAQACDAEGDCWGPCESTSFTATPAPVDVCDQCDRVILTIHVPEELPVQPGQLMAFWYTSVGWDGMPLGPPDGGTEENLVLNPDISLAKPYVMTLPACTYYREHCLAGDYQIFIALLSSPDFPPLPQDGDYLWGHYDLSDAGRFTLGDGPQQTWYLDVTLEKCVDGSCDY
ncbi:MAG: DUF1566 domain-containing protein [Deltaproteobacteria bacterium]|nr:DUF1566 domain-containing protein [Deltaproteobacteria bacterium]